MKRGFVWKIEQIIEIGKIIKKKKLTTEEFIKIIRSKDFPKCCLQNWSEEDAKGNL
jgi:hypothetical protein